MIITSTIVIDVTAHRSGRFYDAAELDRYADEQLSHANPGDFVRILVGDLEPAPVPESFSWMRPDLVYAVDGPLPYVNEAWKQALSAAHNSSNSAGV